jgi:citrate lyase subunit beta/citryl-CoA lyase
MVKPGRQTTKNNNFKLRSFLFVPAIKNKFLKKILTLNGLDKPDVIIFDLEDSVHRNLKKQAGDLLIDYFKNHFKIIKEKYVICLRINRVDSPYFKDDLRIIDKILPDFLMLPKVESGREYTLIRKKTKISKLIILIETITGLYKLEEITNKMNKQDVLAVGPEDFSAQLLIERPKYTDPSPLWHFYNECILRARKNNLILLDGPSREFSDVKALSQLKKECLFSLKIGFNCKMAIHPNQIKIINKIFDKSKVVGAARKFLKSFDNLRDGSFVIINKDKKMMDTPSYKMYKKIINDDK